MTTPWPRGRDVTQLPLPLEIPTVLAGRRVGEFFHGKYEEYNRNLELKFPFISSNTYHERQMQTSTT